MNSRHFLNDKLIESFDERTFTEGKSFPWKAFDQLILPDAFETLCNDFPPIELFDRYWDAERSYGQRPLNRYHLGYRRQSESNEKTEKGVVLHDRLPKSWQNFIEDLESPFYDAFIKKLIGETRPQRRYTWHLGVTTSEVCPHVDDKKKAATHIFYFNKSSEWNPAWGGRLLVLENKKIEAMNPDFDDFEKETPIEFTDNRSFLFKNEDSAWHGVRPLTCPAGSTRRLFNVIFARPRKERPHRIKSQYASPF